MSEYWKQRFESFEKRYYDLAKVEKCEKTSLRLFADFLRVNLGLRPLNHFLGPGGIGKHERHERTEKLFGSTHTEQS